jgi:hypothetical protein
MAEATSAGGHPTFKLVLVGDGGTGKVRKSLICDLYLTMLTDLRQ